MQRFSCDCGNRLFFHNDSCLACQREVSWCPVCVTMTALETEDGHQSCVRCTSRLWKCGNRVNHQVCNRSVLAPTEATSEILCDCCVYNETIPDLSQENNLDHWRELEKAKRRLIYGLNSLGLPHQRSIKDVRPGLSFDFKDDELAPLGFWRSVGKKERVFTGHANGKITIHIREADSVAREQLRVDLGEGHRTLIGHFRHEIGHYYWDVLVRPNEQTLQSFTALFGDANADYGAAMDRHYKEGAPENWKTNFISAYATMHPWEDWAETFAFYLDIVDVMQTINASELIEMPITSNFKGLVGIYVKFGILMNDLNRAMGLIDFLPEVIVPGVMEKLEFVHQVVEEASQTS